MNQIVASWCQRQQWLVVKALGRRSWQVRDSEANKDHVLKIARSEKERFFLANQKKWQVLDHEISGISSASLHYFEDIELLVSRFQRGETLANFIRQQWLNTPNDEQLAAKLSALFYQLERLHGRGCVHGDLTPGNILCADEGIKLLDFANARALGSDDSLRPFFSYTQHYSLPAQCQGSGLAAVEHDWYGFFCIVEIAFAGKPIQPNWQEKHALGARFDQSLDTGSLAKLLRADTCRIAPERIDQLAKAVALFAG